MLKNRKSGLRTTAENLLVAGAIFLASVFTKSLLPSDGTAAIPVLWPSAGVALAAALLLGWRVVPGIFLPFATSGLASDFPWTFGLLSPLGICAVAVLSWWFLGRLKFDPSLSSIRDIFLFAGLGAVLPMGLAGFWTANCLLISGKLPASSLKEIGIFFSTAYAGGALVVTPAILLAATGRFQMK